MWQSEVAKHLLDTWTAPHLKPVRPETPNYATRYFIILISLSCVSCIYN